MARDGSGVFSKLYSFIAGTVIESAKINAMFDDFVTDANAARPATAGGTGGNSVITGWDGLAKKGTDIATASSINLTTATGPSLSLTGTTTVTGVTLSEGSIRVVRAAAAFQITASASLLCNGSSSVNLAVAAEDTLIFRGGAGGVVSVVSFGAYLPKAGGTLTGALNYAPTVTIASASTVNIGAAASNEIIVSGTTTITAFDTVAAGIVRDVLFSGALTLTHNGTSLILPGAANITTAANDTAAFRSLGSGTWVCLWYKRAAMSGIILGSPTASTSGTSIDFTGIPPWAKRITMTFAGMSTNGTNSPLIQIGPSGGPETSGYLGSTNSGATAVNATTGIQLTAGGSASAVFHGSVILTLLDASTNTWAAALGGVGRSDTTTNPSSYGGYSKSLAGVLDRIRLTTVGGTDTFDAGKVNIAYD